MNSNFRMQRYWLWLLHKAISIAHEPVVIEMKVDMDKWMPVRIIIMVHFVLLLLFSSDDNGNNVHAL